MFALPFISAGLAKGLARRGKEELLAGAVHGRNLTIGETARRDPFGQGDGAVAVTERGNVTDAHSSTATIIHQGTYDHHKEHHSLRLRNRGGVRFSP